MPKIEDVVLIDRKYDRCSCRNQYDTSPANTAPIRDDAMALASTDRKLLSVSNDGEASASVPDSPPFQRLVVASKLLRRVEIDRETTATRSEWYIVTAVVTRDRQGDVDVSMETEWSDLPVWTK